MASYTIRATTITTAPPERVFAVLDDFQRWPAWMPSLERVKVELPGGPPGPGYRFRLQGLIVHADMEVLDYTAEARTTSFRISFPPLTGRNRCLVVPLDDGRYRIERVDSIDLYALVAGLLDATQRQRFERLAGEFLDALKREVEGKTDG
jgi:hypothetical protein